MQDIDTLLPLGRGKDTAALREFDADALARYAADPANAWWRRRHCVQALDGRVPEPRVPDLVARVRDTGETAEVRVALLDVLGDRTELLPWLLHEERRDEKRYGMAEAILKARPARRPLGHRGTGDARGLPLVPGKGRGPGRTGRPRLPPRARRGAGRAR
jgi:hypothetical protein